MLKNVYFACCIAIAGSFLWMHDAASLEKNCIALIAEYSVPRPIDFTPDVVSEEITRDLNPTHIYFKRDLEIPDEFRLVVEDKPKNQHNKFWYKNDDYRGWYAQSGIYGRIPSVGIKKNKGLSSKFSCENGKSNTINGITMTFNYTEDPTECVSRIQVNNDTTILRHALDQEFKKIMIERPKSEKLRKFILAGTMIGLSTQMCSFFRKPSA